MSLQHPHPVIDTTRRAALVRRIRFLVVFTISYNAIEAVVALFAGVVASSSALIGFGLDSFIEMSSALAVAWQFSAADHERREKAALRVIALSFFGLAAFVTWDAMSSLISRDAPDASTLGIVIAALSLAVMPTVSIIQRRAGHQLGSHSAVADSKQTLLCAYMSAVLLVALLANSLLGWWWADPIGALVIAALALREGINAWKGEACCAPAAALVDTGDEADRAGASCCAPDCGC